MWTETGQLQVALGLGVPPVLNARQTGDLGSDGFAAVFGQPVTGASAEESPVPTGDPPAGFGMIWPAVPSSQAAEPPVEGASPSVIVGEPVGPDAARPVARELERPDRAAAMAQSLPQAFPHEGDLEPQTGLGVPAPKMVDGKTEDRARSGSAAPDRGISLLQIPTTAERTTVAPVEGTRVAGGRMEIPIEGPKRQPDATVPELPPQAGAMAQLRRPAPPPFARDVAGVTGKSAVAPTGDAIEVAGNQVLSQRHVGFPLPEASVETERAAALPPDEGVDDEQGRTSRSAGLGATVLVPLHRADHLETGKEGAEDSTVPLEPKVADVSLAPWQPAISLPVVTASSEPLIARGLGRVTPEIMGTDQGNQLVEPILAGPKPMLSSGPEEGPDQCLSKAMDGTTDRPAPSPATTEAERVWLGRMHWQDDLAVEPQRTLPKDAVAIPSAGASEAVQRSRPDPVPTTVEVPAAIVVMPKAMPAEPQDSLVSADIELAPLSWSPSGHLAPVGSPVAGSMPAGAVPQLAAVVAASLHNRVDGTTEIALSPDELGSVRLRLEADASDPERMIVHLVFDRPETMDLFRRHADQLSDAIRAAGYAEVRLDFGQNGASANTGSGQETTDGHADTGAATAPGPGPDEQAPTARLPHRLADTAGLDLRL